MKTNMKYVLLWGLAMVYLTQPGHGQRPRIQFSVAIGNHAVSVPFQKISRFTFHPSIQIGIEFMHWHGNHGQFAQSINIGAIYNQFNSKAIFLNTEGIYRYQTGFGLYGETALGVGYMHTFHPLPVYALQDNGAFAKIRNTGKPSAMVSLGFGLGYQFKRNTEYPVSVFARYQPFITLPYSKDLLGLPQSIWQLGTRFSIK